MVVGSVHKTIDFQNFSGNIRILVENSREVFEMN
jgi:hypothetical protein